jgi:nucleoside-diphosphate-sugar epimerase
MIAVTGASGYIGRATLHWLAREGLVVGVGRAAPAFRLSPSASWRATGATAPQPAAFKGCDIVIHLAGRAHTTVATTDGQDLFDLVNRRLALDTAVAARAAGVRRFVFVSTIGVHGNWSAELVRANSPLRLETPYVRSKWAAEQELARLCGDAGMTLCIVRPPMVYGPGCPGNFQRLLRLVASGLPLPFGSMRSVRSFVHVENLASFLAASATRPLPAHSVFVIGDGSDWSTVQLVRAMAEALGKRSRAFPFPLGLLRLAASAVDRIRELDSLSRPMRVDASAAWQACAWQPSVEPASGLRDAVRAYAI